MSWGPCVFKPACSLEAVATIRRRKWALAYDKDLWLGPDVPTSSAELWTWEKI
jgi:hypothetical protein